MRDPRIARAFFALTALVAVVGLVVQLVVVLDADGIPGTVFEHTSGRVFNMFCYFTIQSNIIVAITCALLALRLERPSTVFRVFRLAGVINILVTGVIYHVAIAELHEFKGGAAVADEILHTTVPILGVLGWLVFGPRGLTSPKIAVWALAYPIAWMAFTLVRGPLTDDFYPYEFIDVAQHGYGRVAVNSFVIAAFFLLLAGGANLLDGWLKRRRVGVSPGSPPSRS